MSTRKERALKEELLGSFENGTTGLLLKMMTFPIG
jgi:hypothetical protein